MPWGTAPIFSTVATFTCIIISGRVFIVIAPRHQPWMLPATNASMSITASAKALGASDVVPTGTPTDRR
jgi:hypothetical protein